MTRQRHEVDQRDYMINYLFTGLNHKEIAEKVGLHRTSIYPAIERFKFRYENSAEYRRNYKNFIETIL